MNATHFSFKNHLTQVLSALMIVMLLLTVMPVQAADTGWVSPTSNAATTGGDGNGFETNPTNAYADNPTNGSYAYNSNGAGDRHLYYGYNFGAFPAGAVINGIEVRLDWWVDSTFLTASSMSVELSWNGGTTWTAALTDNGDTTANTHSVILGGTGNTWGHTWTASELSAANFRVRITSTSNSGTRDFYLDWVPVRVTYTIPTTTTLTSSLNPSNQGNSVTFTATVAPAAATGTVNFMEGATLLGTGTLSGGAATFNIAALGAGVHNITAVYAGDSTYITSTSAVLVQVVNGPPAITSANSRTFIVGVAGPAFTVTATGNPAPTFSLGGDPLPNGLTFNGTTGVLNGTPASGTAGVYNLIISATNSAGTDTQVFTLTINQVPAFTSANNTTFTVGTAGSFTVTTTGSPTATITLTGGSLPTGVTLVNNGDGTATLAGTPAAGSGGQRTLTFTANNGVNPNATQTFTFNINEPPAITSANTITFTLGQNNTFTATATGHPAPTWAIGGATLPSGVTFNTGTHVLSGTPASGTVGTYAITFTVTNAGGTATQNFTLNVIKGNQTITFAQPTTPIGFGTTFTVNPTSSSGLPVAVAVTSGPCTIAPLTPPGPYTVTTTGTGTCRLTATQPGDASYNAAASVFRDVAVQPVNTTTTITSSSNPSVLGQMVTFTVRVTSPSGTPTGNVTLSYCEWLLFFCNTPTVTLGTQPLAGGIATFNINTLTVGRNGAYIIPDRVTAVYTPTGGNFNGSQSTLDQTVNTANTITSLTSSLNPSSSGQAVTFTATVVVAPPGAGQVAGGNMNFYDGATLIGNGTVNASGVATFTTSALTMGSHNITAYFQGTNDFGTSTSPILIQMVRRTSATALTSDNNPSVYGEAVTFTATVTGPGGTPAGTVSFYNGAILPANLLGTGTLSGGVATFSTNALVVGSHNITAVYGGDPNNYVPSTSPVVVQVVDQAILTVTADPKTITYGDSDPPFTYVYSGFLLGDDAADIAIPPTCDASAVHVNAGTYTDIIKCSGASDDNYTFAYVDGTLTVNPKALTITADNQGKTYGYTLTFDGDEFTTTGLIFSDTVTSVTLTSAGAAADADTGTYPIVPSAAVGTGLANYTITYVNGTLTVGGNLLIITANDRTKTYGQAVTFAGTEFTVTGLQGSDTVTSVNLTSTGAAANAPVGTYTIIPSAATGSGLFNYAIIYVAGQLDVNQALLTFNPDSHSKVYGSTFNGYTGAFTGLFAFDNTITPAYDSPGAPATATVTAPGPIYPINVTFNDPDDRLRNYILTVDPAPAATLTVTPRTLTVTPTNRSKVYGDVLTVADFTGTITGIQNGDNITATYDSPTGDPATAAVGTYNIVATLSDPDGMLGNYTLDQRVGTLTVTQRDLTISSDSQTKLYGEVFSAFTGSVVGLQNGDVVTPTYNSAGAPAAAAVGNYNITVTPLVDPGNKLPNYHLIYNIGTLAVTRGDLVVTPNDRTKLYGDTITFTSADGVVTGLQNGDAITPNYSSPGAIATATVAGSPYPIVVTLSDPTGKLGNYNVTLNTGTLTINRRPLTVTPADKSKVYGTWFLAFTGAINGIQNGENITANYASTGSAPSAAVGTYPITATLNDPNGKLGNYDVTLNTGTLTVTSSVLTVRADNKTIFYGDPDPAFTFIYSGFMGTDTPAVIDAAPTCTVAGPHTNVGTYPIVCADGLDNNYSFSYVSGTLTVARRTLVVTPADKIKLYGTVFNAFTGTINGIQYGDNITATYTSLGAPAAAPVGTYAITAAMNDPDGKLANYTVILNTGTLTVDPRTLVVTPDNKSKDYGDTFTAYTATVTGIQNGDPITVNYASAGAAATATVGNYPITVTLNDPTNVLSNYTVTLNTGTLTVNRRALIVTPDDKAKVFGTTFTAFSGTVVGLQSGDIITETYASTGAPAAAAAGTYPITVTLSDPGNRLSNYTVTLNTGTLTVGANVLTVTANNQTIVYGDLDPTFTFTYAGFQGSDTQAVIDTPPTCVVAVAHNAVGTYPITCSGGADGNYIFTYIPGTLTVTPRVLAVTPDNKTKVYGDTFTAFTGTITGLQAGDNITVTYASAGATGSSPIGTYLITATLVDPNNRLPNYTVTLNTGTLTVTARTLIVTPDDKNKVYGTAFTTFTGSILGLQGGDSVTVTYSSAGSPATAAVGTYPITATIGDPGNIIGNYAVTLNTGTLTVTQRDLVVTPADKTKIYGDVFSAFTGAIVGIQNGDPITATYTSPGSVAPAPIGSYVISATLNAPVGVLANYNITYNTGTLTVTPRTLVVTPDDKGKPFGTNFTAFTGTIVGLQAGDNITAVYASTGAPASAPAGTYPITVTLNDPGNRLPNYVVTLHTGTLTVGANVLNVTASNQTIVYGSADPIFTFTYAGFQAGDTPAVLTTEPTCQVLPAHNGIGTYPITCSGGVDENYIFSYTPGTLTVTPRALVVTPADKTKVYGNIFTAFTGTVTGVQGGDNITVSYDSNGAPAAAVVGTYPITATLADPSNRLGNYTVTLNTGTLTVTRRTLIVIPDDKNKVYGTLFTAFTGTISGLQNGDNIVATYASAGAITTATVGTYPITATLVDPGNQLPNYAVTLNTGTLTVTGNVLIVTPADKVKTYGDVFSAFTGTVVGVQPGDNITATYSSAGAVANATIGAYDITATLNDPLNRLSNYSSIILNTGTLTVNPRALVVTPDNKTKVFGTTFSAFTGTVTGVQAGDNITVTYASPGAPDTAAAGSYPITATLNDPGNRLTNYNVTLNTATLMIGMNILTVTADNKTMVYGDLEPVFTFAYSGFQGSDTSAVLTTQPTCQVLPAHNAIGSYPITCSGGEDDNYSFSYIAGTLTVTSRPLTVTPDAKTKTYGVDFTAFTGVVTGLQASDNITVVYSSTGSVAIATIGTYPIIATLNDPNNRLGNYTVTLNTGTLTVTTRILLVTPDDKSKVYGSVFTGFTGNIFGIQNGDVITATYASTGAAATAAVGTYPITATLNDPGAKLTNYAVTLNTGTLTVTQRDLVVTPADKTKVYGDVFSAFTGTIVGIQNGDAITATYTSPGSVATATVAGSPYPITATLNAPAGVLASYNVILNTGSLSVTSRALVVTPDNKAKVFGTTFTAFTGVITGIQAGDNITATYNSTGAPAAAPVGSYPITATLNDPGNRLPNYTVTLNQGTLNVGLSVLTITANNQSKVYGDLDPTFTFTYAGFVGTDTAAVIDTQPTCQVSATHNNVGTYSITCSGGIDDNYVFSYAPGTLTVTSRALTVTPDNKTKVYGDTFTTFTGVINGIQGGDNITATYASAGAPANAAVGTYPITAVLNDPGGRLANYNLTLNTGTLTVNTRTLLVTPTDQSKIYGSVFTAFTGTITGIQNGDPITAAYASPGAAATATVGSYNITATVNAPAGVLANYAVTANIGTLIVTQRDLTVTPADKTKVYGTAFSAFTGSLAGLQNGDAITATYSSPGAPANATVGDYPISAALNDLNGRLANYNVTLNTGTLSVSLAATTVAVTSDNNPAGVSDPITFTATVTSPSGTPTGTVTFFNNGNSLGTFTLTNGAATLTINTLPAGAHTITVTYNGDANFGTSTSAPYMQGVGQTITNSVVNSNINPSYLGQSVTLTAHVTSALGVPTGTVTFLDDAITLGTGTLNSAGIATFSTSTLITGTHNITASYGGDPDFFGSVSAVMIQVVIPDTIIDTTPPDPDNDLTPTFTFSSTSLTATFACRVDGSAFAPCSSGDTFGPLAAGTHAFDVRSIDSFGNIDPTPASYTWKIDTSTPDTNIDTMPPVITNSTAGTFTFSSPAADLASFECQLDAGGFSACTGPHTVSGLSAGTHTVEVRAVDTAGNNDPSPASYTWIVDLGFPTVLFNANTVPGNNATTNGGPTKIKVAFSKSVKNDSSTGAANNPANYLLVNEGINGTFDTTTCALGLVADDVSIPIAIPSYSNGKTGKGPFVATFVINGGVALPVGHYRLFVCGTTSVEDLAGNELNDGANDTTLTFTVKPYTDDGGEGGGHGGGNNNEPENGLLIPLTGFPHGTITQLPKQPASLMYTSTDIWLEIPKLGVKLPIVGVPQTATGWDISWLGGNAGWLNGSAFPTWKGNSIITAHAWNLNDTPGPFVGLVNIQYGDRIKIHAYGQVYTYEVTESSLILPTDVDTAFKHKEAPWLTLITCEGYQETTGLYTNRRMIRAMLVSTEKEK